MYVTTMGCHTGICLPVKPFFKVYHDCIVITAFHLLFYKSACTKELLDLLETQILQGVSFLKVS